MITELQKRFEADAYKQKMDYAGSAGIAAEQGFLAGIDFLQHLLQQTPCTTLLELLQQMLNEVEKAYPNISEPYVTSKEVDKYVISNVMRLIKERQPIA